MNLVEYQSRAATEVASYIRSATKRQEYIVLEAPTGAGKTVIAAHFIQDILQTEKNYVFLWVSLSPELNDQTKDRLQQYGLSEQCLHIIDSDTFFENELLSGNVYFLNTSKLAKVGNLLKRGDARTSTFWGVIGETAKNQKLVLVLDEAHWGVKKRDDEERKTIVQSIIDGVGVASGASGEFEERFNAPAIVVGISATPENFVNTLRSRPGTSWESVKIEIDEVRDSKLLKESLVIAAPTTGTGNIYTMLQQGVQTFRHQEERWEAFNRKHAASVKPLLVIQVEDKIEDDPNFIETLIQQFPGLKRFEIRHTFSGVGKIWDDGFSGVDYIEPNAIQSNVTARVVLFKTALSIGWDCPRAEVLVSFRTSLDRTQIVQTLGRMLRNPYQGFQIADPEFADLNEVSLFLPKYDPKIVDNIKSSFAAVETRVGKTEYRLVLNALIPSAAQIVAEAKGLIVSRRLYGEKVSAFEKILDFAAVIQRMTSLSVDQKDEHGEWLDGTIEQMYAAIAARIYSESLSADFKERLSKTLQLSVQELRKCVGREGSNQTKHVPIEPSDLQCMYQALAREIAGDLYGISKEGLENVYGCWTNTFPGMLQDDYLVSGVWKRLENKSRFYVVLLTLRRETVLLPIIQQNVQATLQAVQNHFVANGIALDGDGKKKPAFSNLYEIEIGLRETYWELPSSYTVYEEPKFQTTRSLFATAGADPLIPIESLNDWEKDMVKWLETNPSVLAYLRNPAKNNRFAFAIEYRIDKKKLGLFYPDFIIWFTDGSIGIVDTKGDQDAKKALKWAGMAEWLKIYQKRQHGGKITLVMGDTPIPAKAIRWLGYVEKVSGSLMLYNYMKPLSSGVHEDVWNAHGERPFLLQDRLSDWTMMPLPHLGL